MVYPMIYYIRS